ncbi:MAG: hypothetical protein JWM57_573 [Phycisphaerales bacterium]|nr:hypothetical protein [Phycisphaerales bacterium]
MNPFLESLEGRKLMSVTPGADAEAIFRPPAAAVVSSDPVGKPVRVTEQATDRFNATLANLRGSTASHLSQLGGSIDWGDGSDTSTPTFVRATNGTINVQGAHTYAKAGIYRIAVTLTRRPYVPPGQPSPFFVVLLGQVRTLATVRPDHDGSTDFSVNATQSFTHKLGDFDFRPLDIILDKIRIDWGDGTQSLGTLHRSGDLAGGEYDVLGTHTYAVTGQYKARVVVTTKPAGSSLPSGTAAAFTSTITVGDLFVAV